jgi:AraC family transcriptional regulator of adaptative response/methylated-DNA-[protein]-cysteine methyltransferase
MKRNTQSKILQIRALIESGMTTLTELSAAVGWSPAYLQKSFKQSTGLSPAEYASAHRIGQLKISLRKGADVTQAWVDSGYGSSSRVYENGAARLGMLPSVYRNGGAGMLIHWTITETVLGKALIAATERGICAVALATSESGLLAELQTEFPNAALNPVDDSDQVIAVTVKQVAESLSGNQPSVAVELMGTAFQHKVWQALMTIPKGQTRSYAELAVSVGMPKAARAVARACASNKVAVLVPCHRVIRGDGSLGGYRWGLPLKDRILRQERACDNDA